MENITVPLMGSCILEEMDTPDWVIWPGFSIQKVPGWKQDHSLNFEGFFSKLALHFFSPLPSPAFKRSVLILWEYRLSTEVSVFRETVIMMCI